MSRRFLYMVVGNCSIAPSSYTLHRINPWGLFHPKDSPQRAAAAACARATTIEAERARMKTILAAVEYLRARQRTMMREAMWQRAMEPTTADDAEETRLPAPCMNFSSLGIAMVFALIGQSKDKIVAVDGENNPEYTRNDWEAPGRAVLYDDAAHSVPAQLSTAGLPERRTVPVAVGDNLYFMGEQEEVVPGKGNMRALIRYPARAPDSESDWYWYSFPPPPYDVIGTGENDPRPHYPEGRDMLGAYAVVGDSHIWASTRIRGTFSMDTASGTWSRASDSPLPFSGGAEYAPEHRLWFGFPNDKWQYESASGEDSGLLCAWDLNSVVKLDGGASTVASPLQASGVWEVFGAPSGSFNVRSHLLHLGDGGRFCFAKLYQIYRPMPPGACSRCYNEDGMPTEISFAVLTGVEVVRCDGGELRMVKHKSCKYSFGEYSFPHDLV